MLKNVKEYLYPETLNEALDLLKKKGRTARVAGGGLDLVWRDPKNVEYLIDLGKIGLSYIEEDEEEIRIGATTTIGEMENSLVIGKLFKGKLSKILSTVTTPIIRNVITIGGSVARNYSWSDIIAILLTLNAKLVIYTGKEDEMSISDFMKVETERFLDEAIIKGVKIKKFDHLSHFSYIRFTRTGADIPLLNQGVFIRVNEKGEIEEARVVTGARPFGPENMEKVEEFLAGKKLTDETVSKAKQIAVDTVEVKGDFRLSEEYRRHLTGVLIKRNLKVIREEL